MTFFQGAPAVFGRKLPLESWAFSPIWGRPTTPSVARRSPVSVRNANPWGSTESSSARGVCKKFGWGKGLHLAFFTYFGRLIRCKPYLETQNQIKIQVLFHNTVVYADGNWNRSFQGLFFHIEMGYIKIYIALFYLDHQLPEQKNLANPPLGSFRPLHHQKIGGRTSSTTWHLCFVPCFVHDGIQERTELNWGMQTLTNEKKKKHTHTRLV